MKNTTRQGTTVFFRFSPMDAYIASIKYKIQQDKIHYCFLVLAPWMHTSYQYNIKYNNKTRYITTVLSDFVPSVSYHIV